jgi:hypothetical protein
MRLEYKNVDCAILNTGSLRLNKVLPKGNITYSMIFEIFPFMDCVVVKYIPGSLLV